MIRWFIAALALIALLTDLMVYRQVCRRFPDNKWIRRSWLTLFLVVDILILIALLLVRSSYASTGTLLLLMWIIWSFVAFTATKMSYLIISWPDYFLRRNREKRNWTYSKVGLIAAMLVLGVAVWGATFGRSILRTKNVEIISPKVPDSFDGYRVVQFSDLHLGNYSHGNDIVERMVERINGLDPDIVVFTGDLVNSNANELTKRYMDVLSGIKSKDGVYAVWGNHDLGIYVFDESIAPADNLKLFREKLAEMGWNLLENGSEYIYRGNDSISITGVGFPHFENHNGMTIGEEHSDYDPAEAYGMVNPANFNILLSHTPNVWDNILDEYPADLTLSGHVHAMQFKINLFGWHWSPSEYMYRYWSGHYRDGDKHLYVNDGIGYVMYPMRVGTRPEITVLTLKKK